MDLIQLVVVLIVVGVLLWVVNTYLSSVIDAKILQIINVVVVIAVVLWLLGVFGLWDTARGIRIGGRVSEGGRL
jgi:lipopolysaccharide export LptBFGC system permease protein LptF